jgi:hypothetical protein
MSVVRPLFVTAFFGKIAYSINNKWSICEILLQRLVSGRLIRHLIITRPTPMFPSLNNFFLNWKQILKCFFAHNSKRGPATYDDFS